MADKGKWWEEKNTHCLECGKKLLPHKFRYCTSACGMKKWDRENREKKNKKYPDDLSDLKDLQKDDK